MSIFGISAVAAAPEMHRTFELRISATILATKRFCRLRFPALITEGRSVTTEFGDLTAGRFATTVLDGVCILLEVLKVLPGEQIKVRKHSEVGLRAGRRIARLIPSQNRHVLSGVENLAPCVVVPISDSSLVEVIMVTDEAHIDLIRLQ